MNNTNPYIRSWGYIPPKQSQHVFDLEWKDNASAVLKKAVEDRHSVIAYGNGRSYGDSCFNTEGAVLRTGSLNKFIEFDQHQGLLTLESGCRFSQINSLIVPAGWFLPVTPGTSQVTVGGAIANDVHGKNHHQDGTIGCHILSLELQNSQGELFICSRDKNRSLFNATIGGLGLTGLILSATIKLIPIESEQMDVRYDTFFNLQEFTELSQRNKAQYRYTVAWLDCASSGNKQGRGIFISANHSFDPSNIKKSHKRQLNVPVNFPAWFPNKYSIRCFNELYFFLGNRKSGKTQTEHYKGYFYPLDAIANWNRIYGSKGFYQYQFVVPIDEIEQMEKILSVIAESGIGSFLSVLKEFGSINSPGIMSFPRPGYCLALDFAWRKNKTEKLIKLLDAMVTDVGGAAYPAKDRLMDSNSFLCGYPNQTEFKNMIDPNFSSDFWKRVSNN